MKKKEVLKKIINKSVKTSGPFTIKFGPTSLSTPPTTVRTTRSGSPETLYQGDNTTKRSSLVMRRPITTNSPAIYGPAMTKDREAAFKPSKR